MYVWNKRLTSKQSSEGQGEIYMDYVAIYHKKTNSSNRQHKSIIITGSGPQKQAKKHEVESKQGKIKSW